MAKKMKEWSGPLEDLVKFGAYEVSEAGFWVVRFNQKTYQVGKTVFYTTKGRAKGALKRQIIANYHQGHYWHKGSKNTFADEGGHYRNGGIMANLDKEFKVMGTETTEWLLNEGIFTIERIKV